MVDGSAGRRGGASLALLLMERCSLTYCGRLTSIHKGRALLHYTVKGVDTVGLLVTHTYYYSLGMTSSTSHLVYSIQ